MQLLFCKNANVTVKVSSIDVNNTRCEKLVGDKFDQDIRWSLFQIYARNTA